MSWGSRMRAVGLGLFLGLGGASCTGTIEGADVSNPNVPPGGDGGIGASHGYTRSPGLRRLTRIEYRNTLRDLLGVEIDPTRVPKELLVRGHSTIGGAQKTGYADIEAYYDLALRVAEEASPAILERESCDSFACLEAFARTFVPLAFRGTTDASVEESYRAILADETAGATPAERLTTFLSAVLSSPHFLYRQEIGEGASGDVFELAPHEIATKLSYLVWQSTPDAELLAAGDALLDPAGRAAQLERMLADPRAKEGLRGFVRDWMGVFENRIPTKDESVLAGLPSDVAAAAEQSFDLAIDFEAGAIAETTFLSFLTTDRIFANETIAAIVGLDVSGADFVRTAIPTSDRLGFLTHPMVLAAHTKESGASPFPVGKFLYENVLCEVIPPPPPGIPTAPDDEDSEQTLRERLEALTKNEPCHSCHTRIGPPGFAFLPFDPVGRFREEDGRGRPYDTSGELVVVGERIPFANTVDLIRVLSERDEVARCLAKRLFRFAHGRFEATFDAAELDALEGVSTESRAHVESLLARVITAPSFTQARIVQ